MVIMEKMRKPRYIATRHKTRAPGYESLGYEIITAAVRDYAVMVRLGAVRFGKITKRVAALQHDNELKMTGGIRLSDVRLTVDFLTGKCGGLDKLLVFLDSKMTASDYWAGILTKEKRGRLGVFLEETA